MKAKRIQRKRTKGWRMPANTVYVGRGSKWGNPFVIGKHGTAPRCVQMYENLLSCLLVVIVDGECIDAQMRLVKYAHAHISDLRGKNLACWCSLHKPCHADVLLEIANEVTV